MAWVFLQETVIEIEVIERNPAPSLADEFDHKDWVSSVHINSHWWVVAIVPRKIRMSIYGVLTLGHSSKRLETLSLSKEQRYNSY